MAACTVLFAYCHECGQELGYVELVHGGVNEMQCTRCGFSVETLALQCPICEVWYGQLLPTDKSFFSCATGCGEFRIPDP